MRIDVLFERVNIVKTRKSFQERTDRGRQVYDIIRYYFTVHKFADKEHIVFYQGNSAIY